MERWRRYTLYFKTTCSFFLGMMLVLMPVKLSMACGGGDYEFLGYSFLDVNVLNKEYEYAPYFLTFSDLYQNLEETKVVQQKDNLGEWSDIFCGMFPKKDLRQIIYNAAISDLKLIRTATAREKSNLPARLSQNVFARHLVANKCVETINYLIFTRQCQPHVVASSNSWEAPKRDSVKMQKLIEAGEKNFKKTKSNYIRMRYTYQLVRLAHYSKNYEQVLDLYRYLIPKFDKQESIINYWTLGHRAGALRALGQRAEAAYLYSLIFQYCPSKRESAFRSFYIKTDQEWDDCMMLCKSDAERATLYTIRANAVHAKSIEEMEKIYKLDPENENLELLLVKEMMKVEKDLLGLEFNDKRKYNKRNFNIPRKDSGKYLLRLHEFVRKCIKEDKVGHPDLWAVADGYLEFLGGDFYAAENTFANLRKTIDNKPLQKQLETFQLALKIASMETVDNEDEMEIFNIIATNEEFKSHEDFPDFLYDKLAKVYTAAGEKGKAFRCHHNIYDLAMSPDMEVVEDLIEIEENPDKNRFERAMVADENGNSLRNKLIDIKGTIIFSQFKPEAALKILKGVPATERKVYTFNPFHESINDCVHCEVHDTVSYTKVDLIEKMLRLEYEGRADLEKGAEYFYELGLAYYNMSYFGNAWEAMDYYRSGNNWYYVNDENIYDAAGLFLGNKETVNCERALHYFETTRLLSKSKELAARASFMAAKCQLNMYYISKDCNYSRRGNKMPNPPEKYRTYFNYLKKDYADTNFYQQAMKECKYFRAFSLRE